MNGNRHTMVTKRPPAARGCDGITKMSFRACARCLSVGDLLLPGKIASFEKSQNAFIFHPNFHNLNKITRISNVFDDFSKKIKQMH